MPHYRFLVVLCSVICFKYAIVNGQDPTVCESVHNQPGCVCKTSEGKYISLLNLANRDLSSSLTASYGDYKYSYNPCFGVDVGVTSGACNKEHKQAGCQQTSDESEAYGIGSIETETIFKDTDGSYFISYNNGQGDRHSKIKLICDQKADTPKLDTTGDDGHQGDYAFQLTSSASCETDAPPPSSQKPSSNNEPIGLIGIVVIIVAMFGLITYFVVGILINKFVFKKTSRDIVPQKTFWFSLHLLIRDGVLFTFSPLIRLVRRDYQPLA